MSNMMNDDGDSVVLSTTFNILYFDRVAMMMMNCADE